MSRPTSEWTAAMKCATDHSEIRRLYANGGTVAQEWLVEQIVKHCSAHALRDGRLSLADIKCAAAGKVSRPTLNKYIDDLLKCGALNRVAKSVFQCPIAERICGSFVGRGNKLVRICKNSYTPQNAFIGAESPPTSQNKLTSTVPDLERDLSKNLKAKTPSKPRSAANPSLGGDTPTVPLPALAAQPPPSFSRIGSLETKDQVARQAGSRKDPRNIADVVLSMGMSVSGLSMKDIASMQEIDWDALDTEELLRQEALLSGDGTASTKAAAPAAKASPPTQASPAAPQMPAMPAPRQTTQPLPKSVIRFNLGEIAAAIPDFTYGEKEVNALRKWPITEAQLVDLRRATVAHRGSLMVGAGAYLYGAVRRASLGLLPTLGQRKQNGLSVARTGKRPPGLLNGDLAAMC